MNYNERYRPGCLEVICGCMKSGKTKVLLNRIEQLKYLKGINHRIFKPDVDKRFSETRIIDRTGEAYTCTVIGSDDLGALKIESLKNVHVIALDEVQFFSKDFAWAIHNLTREGKNVIVAGLDMDFRGEGFGIMPELLAVADKVTKLTAVCEYSGCNSSANRSQRLINGVPAHYESEQILVADNECYEPRCIYHHYVPGK